MQKNNWANTLYAEALNVNRANINNEGKWESMASVDTAIENPSFTAKFSSQKPVSSESPDPS